MLEAVSTHASRLSEKLRKQGLGTDHITFFDHTSSRDTDQPQRSVSTTLQPAVNTRSLNEAAFLGGLKSPVRCIQCFRRRVCLTALRNLVHLLSVKTPTFGNGKEVRHGLEPCRR